MALPLEERCANLDLLHDWADKDRVVNLFTKILNKTFTLPMDATSQILSRYFPNKTNNPEAAVMNALIESDINFRGMIPTPARIWTSPICLKLQEARSLLHHGMLPKIFFFEKNW